MACSLVVTTTADVVNPSDGVNSLREAIICANATPGADAINLSAGTYQLTLSGDNEDQAQTGDLDITDDLTINGIGQVTIDGSGSEPTDRIFDVHEVNAEFNSLTITGGDVMGNGGGIRFDGPGTLTILETVIDDNTASQSGGGIHK